MAYAAVISLKHTIQRVRNPTINPELIDSAYEELDFIEVALRRLDGSSIKSSVIDALDSKIREAVCKLEDVLESYVFRHSLPPSETLSDKIYPQIPSIDEKGVKKKMVSFLKTVQKLKEKYIRELQNPSPGEDEEDDDVSPLNDSDRKRSTVEVELSDQFGKVRDELLDLHNKLKVVSLVGMAGIGKTFLARKIYSLLIMIRHFNLTAWVKVGFKNNKRDVLMDILGQIEPANFKIYNMEQDIRLLGRHLHQSLYGWRFLIVLDDVGNTGVCDYLMSLFPDNGNGSRVLLTTRLETVAYRTTYSMHKMRFLNDEESWNLLWQNVFEENFFPPELEKAGRKIAKHCEGLPLLILVVANILSGLDKTQDFWKQVADKKTTTFTDAYDRISKVLSSSYEYLSQYLKACFLYMGVFPQNCEIPMSRLMNLWIVEDFLDSKHHKNLQDFAMECLKKLVSQSLVLICEQSSNLSIKSSKLHSAYWHVCVKEARKTKFLHVLNKLIDGSNEYIDSQRRLSVQNNVLLGIKDVYDSMAAATLTTRSLLCTGEYHEYPVAICLNLMLLKVLDALTVRFYEFPIEVVKLSQLRYLSLTHNGCLSSFISQLQNLQCLIVRQHHNIKLVRDYSTCYPKEIWDMQELRHLRMMSNKLPDPSKFALLPNLVTLYVNGRSCTEVVYRSTRYLKKLGIKIELQPDGPETLSCFHHIELLEELESLKCVVVNPRLRSQVVAPPDDLSNLPWSLRKLSLTGLAYSWEYMSAIGLLPNLQVLKLQCSAFQGSKWITEVGVFQSLEHLLLEDIDMVEWTSDDDNCFPCLQRLIIRHCYKLRVIPSQIGDIPALKTIEIVDSSPSMVASAQQIQEEQMYQGNFYLQVLITSSWK